MGSERMNDFHVIAALLPPCYEPRLRELWPRRPQELRLLEGRPVTVRLPGGEAALLPPLTQGQLEEILQRACRFSSYAYQETLRQGYVTLEGGHRLGVCGFGVVQAGQVTALRSPTSLNLRIARAIPGCAGTLVESLKVSTLLLGPPGAGKTTLLRDCVRLISNGGQWVGLADERGEVSAQMGLDVGQRTDVLLNVPKAEAVMMLLRTMSPDWIALDEITAPADLRALEQAAYCGVKLLATAHADGLEDLQRRPLYRQLTALGVFDQAAVLRPDKSYTLKALQLPTDTQNGRWPGGSK